jgi:hypothetical protein
MDTGSPHLLQTCEALSPRHDHVKFSTFLKRNRSTSFDLAWTRFGVGSCCRPCCQACASHSHQLRLNDFLMEPSIHPFALDVKIKIKGGSQLGAHCLRLFTFTLTFSATYGYMNDMTEHFLNYLYSFHIRIADIVFSSGSELSSGLAHHRTH